MERTQNTSTQQSPVNFIELCRTLRVLMIDWEKAVLKTGEHPEMKTPSAPNENKGEAMANIKLAYRHIEDARMRIGKAIQAMDGGVSVYDKKQ